MASCPTRHLGLKHFPTVFTGYFVWEYFVWEYFAALRNSVNQPQITDQIVG